MKRLICLLMSVMILCSSCVGFVDQGLQLDLTQARNISELATIECYYHNVARFYREKSSTWKFWEPNTKYWPWEKDTKFWIEYEGTIKMGVDASEIKMDVDGKKVVVVIPKAKILDVGIDEKTFNKKSYVIGTNTTAPEVIEQVKAMASAEKRMVETAKNDVGLLNNAQQEVGNVLNAYIKNVGDLIGVKYKIVWKYE